MNYEIMMHITLFGTGCITVVTTRCTCMKMSQLLQQTNCRMLQAMARAVSSPFTSTGMRNVLHFSL